MSQRSKKSQYLTVSQLTDGIKNALNSEFPDVWVKAEISGITKAASGHFYLTLKDEYSQISAIIWRSNAEKLRFVPENGQEVLCRAFLDVYPQRGTYQLIVQQLQPVGQGALQLAFRQLHDRLKSEGLFDSSRKQPLPRFPRRVAVVTSPTGAAVHDFLQVVQRRWPKLNVTILPTKVQGSGAAEQIADAIRTCTQQGPEVFDVVVVTRGGGSIEDLWSFNEEVVCRAIHDCTIPVISAVGHEVDVTLSDMVADLRALTPTEAGERLVPDLEATVTKLHSAQQQMTRRIHQLIAKHQDQLERLASRPVIQRPTELIRRQQAELDRLAEQLASALPERMTNTRHFLNEQRARLERSLANILPIARLRLSELAEHAVIRQPKSMLHIRAERLKQLDARLERAKTTLFIELNRRVEHATARLEAFNPLAVLSRGYSLTTNLQNVPLNDCQNLSVGDKIQTQLGTGRLVSRIEEIEQKNG